MEYYKFLVPKIVIFTIVCINIISLEINASMMNRFKVLNNHCVNIIDYFNNNSKSVQII